MIPAKTLKCSLLPFKDAKADDTFYADISDFINAGNTTPFIYSGWENTIVNTGTKMQEFMQDKASIKDVADQLDEDQDSVVNNQPEVITTATEEISQESCSQSWVGRMLCRRQPEVTLLLYPLEHGSVEMVRTRTMMV